MDRELTITPILINHQQRPGPNSWAKLLIYEPTEADVIAARGQMYAVLSLASSSQMDFTPLMQMIIESLQQRYFGLLEGGIMQTLESALDAIHKQLILAGQQDKRLSAGFSFDILAAVNWGTVLYLGQLGSSRACLIRQQKLYEINDPSGNMFLSSGVIQAGDRFLLATGPMLTKFSDKQLVHHLGLPQDTLASALEQPLDHSDSSKESGLVLLIDIKQVPSLEEEALHIRDADKLIPAKPASPFSRLKKIIQQGTNATKLAASALWRWRLFNRLPGLPLLIILLCLVALAASITFKYFAPSTTKTSSNLVPTINQLQDKLNQAQSVSSINPDRAQDLLSQMEPTLSEALTRSHDKRLVQIQQSRQQLEATLLNIQTLTPHPIAQISGSVSQPKMTFWHGNLYIVTSQRQLLKLDHNNLASIATNAQIFNKAQLAGTANGLVAIQSQEAVPLNAGRPGDPVTMPAGNLISTTSFQQNAYALTDSGQLYRINDQGDSLADPTKYFPSPISPSGLRDVAIDGSVYILRNDGTIEKYLSAQRKDFSIERAALAKNTRAIFTNENTSNIYLLGDKALLAWTKDGQYVGQYQLPDNTSWQAAAIDSATKTLYILSEGKLVEAQLP